MPVSFGTGSTPRWAGQLGLVKAEEVVCAFKRLALEAAATVTGEVGGIGAAGSRIRRWVRRAMRRFEPAASRVRRLRSSINIATFPGTQRPDGESI